MNRRNSLNFLLLALVSVMLATRLQADNTCLTFQDQQYACAISDANTIPERNVTIEMWFRTRNGGGLFGIVASDPGVQDYDRCSVIQNGVVRHYLWRIEEGRKQLIASTTILPTETGITLR